MKPIWFFIGLILIVMGGGFGGCTINLIENKYHEEIKEKFSKKYKQKFNIELKTYITLISNGTSVIELN